VSSTLNVVAFSLLGAFAQLSTTTSRVVIVAYSFPVWASLLAWLILGEKLRTASTIGLVLCVAGLAILVYPVLSSPSASIGLLLALGSALGWAAGTIYLKIFRIPGDLIVVTTWQVIFAAFAAAICVLLFEGVPKFAPLAPSTILAILYNGLVGTGLAYLMWYKIITHLPTATASLGVLAVPVVGVAASAIMLGERPTLPDIIGFALIFAAAACVILQPRDRKAAATP
jgi:drug/metabolite transporter (DMT)-like permease